MPNKFLIYYNDYAGSNDIMTIHKALNNIGPGPIKQQCNKQSFIAILNWRTTVKDLALLKDWLNNAANIIDIVCLG